MKSSLRTLTLWKATLPNVEHGLLPPSVPRPNPLVIGSSVFISVFAPGAIVCLSRNTGETLWRRELPPLGGDSAYFAAGSLFAKTAHTLYALDPDSGRELWRFCPYGTAHEFIYSHPVVAQRRLFIGDRRGFLHCLDVNSGKQIWSEQTNSKQADVNSTPVVVNGLVVVGTNARTAVAFNVANGRRVWKRHVDGPAVFGLIRHRRLIVVSASSVYLVASTSGEVQRRLSWPNYSLEGVEDFGTRLMVLMRDHTMHGNSRIAVCDIAKQTTEMVSHKVWCPILRYVPETRIGYLSHLHGVRLLDNNANTISDLRIDEDGVGLVDVHDGAIYAATGRGRVLAIRHPLCDRLDNE